MTGPVVLTAAVVGVVGSTFLVARLATAGHLTLRDHGLDPDRPVPVATDRRWTLLTAGGGVAAATALTIAAATGARESGTSLTLTAARVAVGAWLPLLAGLWSVSIGAGAWLVRGRLDGDDGVVSGPVAAENDVRTPDGTACAWFRFLVDREVVRGRYAPRYRREVASGERGAAFDVRGDGRTVRVDPETTPVRLTGLATSEYDAASAPEWLPRAEAADGGRPPDLGTGLVRYSVATLDADDEACVLLDGPAPWCCWPTDVDGVRSRLDRAAPRPVAAALVALGLGAQVVGAVVAVLATALG